jgi:hypothetical protein
MRRKERQRVFLYRRDRVDWRVPVDSQVRTLKVVEQGRRKWRVSEGDVLLFTEGRGLALRFVGYSKILHVEARQFTEGDALVNAVTATAGPLELLPEELLLGRFMYSLTVVSNFSRPWLHVRHRARLPEIDLETLRESRVAWDRTMFFGLLRDLPGRWREFLENQSRALRARSDIQRPQLEARAVEGEPVRELLTLVEQTLLSSARLASDVQVGWTGLFGAASLASLQVVEPNGAPESWVLPNLLSGATRRSDTLDAGWIQIRDVPIDTTFEGGQTLWRPHRW